MNPQPESSKPRIAMVIDDNDLDQFVTKKLIKAAQFADHVISEWSAQDALKFLKENESHPEKLPDVIFLDIRMPEMDGFEFLDEYHKFKDDMKVKVRIVMLSSSSDPKDRIRANESPLVQKFLSKPLSMTELKDLGSVLMFKAPAPN